MNNINDKRLVYIVEDSIASGALYASQLEQAGYECKHFTDGYSALVGIKEEMPAVIVQDVCLPDISGLEVLQFVNKQKTPANVVMITSNSSIDVAVEAMRLGGFDFLEKPFTGQRLISSVESALTPKEQVKTKPSVDKNTKNQDFVGESLAMKTVFRLLDSAARSKACVFITGESGTGKEVCAQTLHDASPRNKGPFIAINCAAIPAELFESEFFGHVKGAFSGALSDRKGAVEVANGGTLFLDELCEMELNLQAKLLRFLQTGIFSRVGSSEVLHSDVRLVCATNRNPIIEVAEGRFREDLYYRLNVIPVKLPPLRERGNDILLLADYILKQKSDSNAKSFISFSEDVKSLFCNYDWPGNIRELQNVIENTVVINDAQVIEREMLPSSFGLTASVPSTKSMPSANMSSSNSMPSPMAVHDIEPLWQVEKRAIENAIQVCDDNIPLAAAYLGVSASTIYRKIKGWS
ncbi:sigma-54 dependent transcriptional regulator [Pseudoalteromonas sp. MMG007]|uniref:sigma-54-dependent transcriptional regulator n=1 Tax=Pseudoalteromonas sp. MMG007 TaxID=2822684 RepID=UPI001B361FB6|nr:sigma-54 dependent transcriptional regulator [Pseudoalteromonas sp. MMG007]MBQ4857971.1 sigma-54-dependent Fis family transcriptional regulator [Pseudoalteromonas sp. MMG007]